MRKKLIDKDALAREIERRIKYDEMVMDHNTQITELLSRELNTLYELSSFIKSLEVKEVDLEKEIKEVKHNYKVDDNRHTSICSADIEWLAEHFFELGIKAQKGEYIMKAKPPVDFFSVYSEEEVAEIDKRIERKQKEYDAKLRDRMMKAKDFPMTD